MMPKQIVLCPSIICISRTIITFSTNSCIMVESWTEPFAYLTRWKLYYVITSHISTQDESTKMAEETVKDPASKNSQELATYASSCHLCKFLPALQVLASTAGTVDTPLK